MTTQIKTIKGDGTGYLVETSSSTYGSYYVYNSSSTAKVVTGNITAPITVTTGYVKVPTIANIRTTAVQVGDTVSSTDTSKITTDRIYTDNSQCVVNVNDGLTITVPVSSKSGSPVTLDAEVSVALTDTSKGTVSGKQTVTAAEANSDDGKELTFTITGLTTDIANGEIVVTAKDITTPFAVADPTIKETSLNGLTVTATKSTASARQGDTVTVTVTISGTASAATKLSLDDTTDNDSLTSLAWESITATGVTPNGKDLTIAANSNFVTPLQVRYTFVVGSEAPTTEIEVKNA
jgi:hypothetical protein